MKFSITQLVISSVWFVKQIQSMPIAVNSSLQEGQCNLLNLNCEEATSNPCNEFDVEFCDNVNCIDSCQATEFKESLVECQGDESCSGATFRSTEVNCNGTKSCLDANMLTSAIRCPIGGSYPSCYRTTWFHCNCCMPGSVSCLDGIPLCYDPQIGSAEEFCSSSFLGRTCKDWGNPVCDDVAVESLPPLHTAENCTAQKEIVECESSKESCNGLQFDSCAVNCVDACQGGDFESSTVACQGFESCSGATFNETYLWCLGQYSCASAVFVASSVFCPIGGSYPSCYRATWNQCTCCLGGNGCPNDVRLCINPQTQSTEEFCNTVVEGRTCKEWGNPICLKTTIPPTIQPTSSPTIQPTVPPTIQPTSPPTIQPTLPPTTQPTFPDSNPDSLLDGDADSGSRHNLLLLNSVSLSPILIYFFFVDLIIF